MYRGDERPLGASGLNELPPYYSKRLQVVSQASAGAIRGEHPGTDVDASAERLFRDFKMGLLTLVVVALLLLAYFWDGERAAPSPDLGEREDVLSFSLTGRRRAEVIPAIRPVHTATPPGVQTPRTSLQVAARESAPSQPRSALYTVRAGDTLSGIALRFYGNAAMWRVILEANRARLRRPADLRPGMKLVVPSPKRTAGSRTSAGAHLARAGPYRRR